MRTWTLSAAASQRGLAAVLGTDCPCSRWGRRHRRPDRHPLHEESASPTRSCRSTAYAQGVRLHRHRRAARDFRGRPVVNQSLVFPDSPPGDAPPPRHEQHTGSAAEPRSLTRRSQPHDSGFLSVGSRSPHSTGKHAQSAGQASPVRARRPRGGCSPLHRRLFDPRRSPDHPVRPARLRPIAAAREPGREHDRAAWSPTWKPCARRWGVDRWLVLADHGAPPSP